MFWSVPQENMVYEVGISVDHLAMSRVLPNWTPQLFLLSHYVQEVLEGEPSEQRFAAAQAGLEFFREG